MARAAELPPCLVCDLLGTLQVIHLPFIDRRQAGRLLADRLAQNQTDTSAVVLGLARGGLPVAFEVAKRLHLQLDIMVVRKIGVPWQPELAMGAMTNSVQILDAQLIQELGIPRTEVERVIAKEMAELSRRERLYRAGAPELPLRRRPVILVDDGLATGNTMRVATQHVRKFEPNSITVAVPVGSRSATREVRSEVDDLVCLAVAEPFNAVGSYYRDFEEVSDFEVQSLLASVGEMR